MGNTENPIGRARAWMEEGMAVALATVVETWGSAPCPIGSQLAVNEKGEFAGSVSGGCIEGFLVSEAVDVITDGEPQVLKYGITDDQAREVHLACGGTIRVYVERIEDKSVIDALNSARPLARVVNLNNGASALVRNGSAEGRLVINDEAMVAVQGMLGAEASGPLSIDGRELLVVVYMPPQRLIVIGAVHITQFLVPMAATIGFEVTVIDQRPAFARSERLPGTVVITNEPGQAIRALVPDVNTAVVALAHDPLLDDPALKAALASPAYYIGCLGSRRTHAKRLERLRSAGFGETELARLHGPVGLDIGARSPGEIAVSVLAEVIAVKHGKSSRS